MALHLPALHLPQLLSHADCASIVREIDFIVPPPDEPAGQRVDLLYGAPPRLAVDAARRAFAAAAQVETDAAARKGLARLALQGTALAAQAAIYGVGGSMAAHVDASVNRQKKPLVILSMGSDCVFGADAFEMTLQSGDALVIDAAAVMHAVKRIVSQTSSIDALRNGRLSLMLWEAPAPPPKDHAQCISPADLFRGDDDA
ncbi:hypothetical protein M885DRAFT_614062 [Pelagophyceae sp. CCMP2097]|nr:hypothetical protein M885DRAFT_614062 [Pelagophyceae sp. CCMP2097]